jgi:hypothetical protein
LKSGYLGILDSVFVTANVINFYLNILRVGENSNKSDLKNFICPVGSLFGILNSVGILMIMKRPINPINSILIPVLAIASLSYFKFEKIIEKSKEYESEKDPVTSCMKLCKITYTPLD